MDKRLFFLMNTAQHTLHSFINSKCERSLGISVTQVATLLYIAKKPGCSQKDITGVLALQHTAVVGLLKRMEKNDLISKQIRPNDKRTSQIFLTEKAKKILPAAPQLISQMNELIVEDFSKNEIETVTRFLNKIKSTFAK
ncbi:MAG: MarR family winged helix-turn-helix transcriptional regulator [Oligoflexales bacterium]